MASGTADLQRDLGGALMQSILGALLTAGYATSVAVQTAASPQSAQISSQVEAELQKSFASAAQTAQQYPQYSTQIIDGAKEAFLQGASWAYAVGALAVVLGAALVRFMFPSREGELELLAEYHATDSESAGTN